MLNPSTGPPVSYGAPNLPYYPFFRQGNVLCFSGLPRTYTEEDMLSEYMQYGAITYAVVNRDGTGQVSFASHRSAAAAEEAMLHFMEDPATPDPRNMPYMRNSPYVPVNNTYHHQEQYEVDMQNLTISFRDDGSRQLVARPNMQRMHPGAHMVPPSRYEEDVLHKSLLNRFGNLPTETGKCAECGVDTSYTCFRCGTFFCSRGCQSKSWPTHKNECEIDMPPLNFSGPKFLKHFNEYAYRAEDKKIPGPKSPVPPPTNAGMTNVNERSPQRKQSGARGSGSRHSESSDLGDDKCGERPDQHQSSPRKSLEPGSSYPKQQSNFIKSPTDNSRHQSGFRGDDLRQTNNEKNRLDGTPNKRQYGSDNDNTKQFNKYDRPRTDHFNRSQNETRDSPRQPGSDKPRNENSGQGRSFSQRCETSNHFNKNSRGLLGDRPSPSNRSEDGYRDGAAWRRDGQSCREGPDSRGNGPKLGADNNRTHEFGSRNSRPHVNNDRSSSHDHSNNLPSGNKNGFSRSDSQPHVSQDVEDFKKSPAGSVKEVISKSNETGQSKDLSNPQLNVQTSINVTAVETKEPLSSNIANDTAASPGPSSEPRNIKDVKSVQLKSGSNVVISHSKGAHVFLRPVDEENLMIFDNLVCSLAKYCLSAPPLNRAPKKREFLACKFKEDGNYYRAVVEDRVSGSNGSNYQYTIRYVDFGNKEDADKADMVLLNDELAKIPLMAVKTYLKDVEIISLNEEAAALLQSYFVSETLLTVEFEGSESPLCVELKEANGSSVNQKIRELMGLNLKEAPEPPPVEDAVPKEAESIRQRISLEDTAYVEFPPVGTKLQVAISHIHPVGVFMCYPADSPSLSDIRDLFFSIPEYALKCQGPYHPELLEMVIVKWSDGDWYRAMCQDIVGDGVYEVLFVDHGNSDTVKSEDIRPFTKKFAEVPILCSPCKIYDVDLEKVDVLEKVQAESNRLQCWIVEATVREKKDNEVMILESPDITKLL